MAHFFKKKKIVPHDIQLRQSLGTHTYHQIDLINGFDCQKKYFCSFWHKFGFQTVKKLIKSIALQTDLK